MTLLIISISVEAPEEEAAASLDSTMVKAEAVPILMVVAFNQVPVSPIKGTQRRLLLISSQKATNDKKVMANRRLKEQVAWRKCSLEGAADDMEVHRIDQLLQFVLVMYVLFTFRVCILVDRSKLTLLLLARRFHARWRSCTMERRKR